MPQTNSLTLPMWVWGSLQPQTSLVMWPDYPTKLAMCHRSSNSLLLDIPQGKHTKKMWKPYGFQFGKQSTNAGKITCRSAPHHSTWPGRLQILLSTDSGRCQLIGGFHLEKLLMPKLPVNGLVKTNTVNQWCNLVLPNSIALCGYITCSVYIDVCAMGYKK